MRFGGKVSGFPFHPAFLLPLFFKLRHLRAEKWLTRRSAKAHPFSTLRAPATQIRIPIEGDPLAEETTFNVTRYGPPKREKDSPESFG
jgi:hypothetical protein